MYLLPPDRRVTYLVFAGMNVLGINVFFAQGYIVIVIIASSENIVQCEFPFRAAAASYLPDALKDLHNEHHFLLMHFPPASSLLASIRHPTRSARGKNSILA